jgi:predicted N-formylglutamate amidohydrolase
VVITHPVEIVKGVVDSNFLLLCDHASNHIPDDLNNLGLSPEYLERHIAYDIGAAAMTRAMAQHLKAPAILTRFSRLIIDPNRGPDDPTLVMRLSDKAIIPGNARITEDDIAERKRRFYDPYDEAIRTVLDEAERAGKSLIIISNHSFTPCWQGYQRPWQVGLLWDGDDRIARPVINALTRDKTLCVGDNEPYGGGLPGDTIQRHASTRSLRNVLVEVRQDLISTQEGAEEWALKLSKIVCDF